MIRSRRLLAAGFAAAIGIAGVTIGSGSLSASSGGGVCEGIDLGATAVSAPAGPIPLALQRQAPSRWAPQRRTQAGTEPTGTEPAGTEPAGSEPAGAGQRGAREARWHRAPPSP